MDSASVIRADVARLELLANREPPEPTASPDETDLEVNQDCRESLHRLTLKRPDAASAHLDPLVDQDHRDNRDRPESRETEETQEATESREATDHQDPQAQLDSQAAREIQEARDHQERTVPLEGRDHQAHLDDQDPEDQKEKGARTEDQEATESPETQDDKDHQDQADAREEPDSQEAMDSQDAQERTLPTAHAHVAPSRRSPRKNSSRIGETSLYSEKQILPMIFTSNGNLAGAFVFAYAYFYISLSTQQLTSVIICN